jgi:UrcA family protein
MMMKTSLMALGVALTLSTAASATTTDNPFAQSKAVLQLKGLDLTTADGQQRLAIRMDQAARAVCGDNLSSVHIAMGEQARECRASVIADLRNRIEMRSADAATKTPLVRVASIR